MSSLIVQVRVVNQSGNGEPCVLHIAIVEPDLMTPLHVEYMVLFDEEKLTSRKLKSLVLKRVKENLDGHKAALALFSRKQLKTHAFALDLEAP